MSTVETPELTIGVAETIDTDGIEKIPDMVTHVYHLGETVAFCGLSHENDPHSLMHTRRGDEFKLMPRGTRFCPDCGAPVCAGCYAKNS
jgi:hypothetical protein